MVSTAEHVGARSERDASAAEAVRVRSRRFGSFEVPSASVLHVPQGLVGFPDLRRYVVLDHRPGSPFKWLLSMDDPELAFAIANPGDLVPDYHPPVELAARLLDTDPAEIGFFVIVTIPPDPTRMTVNLMAPIVVDMRTRRARQIVLDTPCSPPDYLVLSPRLAARA